MAINKLSSSQLKYIFQPTIQPITISPIAINPKIGANENEKIINMMKMKKNVPITTLFDSLRAFAATEYPPIKPMKRPIIV